MITNKQQLESWIKNAGFSKWFFSQTDHNKLRDGERPNDYIISIDLNDSKENLDVAIDRTYDYLVVWGGRCYGQGFVGAARTGGWAVEAQISDAVVPGSIYQQTAGVGTVAPAAPQVDMAAERERMKKEILAEMKEATYEQRMAELAKREKEFEAQKNGALGLLVEYSKPIIAAISGARATTHVGVIDQPGVTAEPIIAAPAAEVPGTEEPEEESIFTDEEADALLDLMARFKAVEPNYLQMIRKVVEMAETNDPMYGAAKGFLCK